MACEYVYFHNDSITLYYVNSNRAYRIDVTYKMTCIIATCVSVIQTTEAIRVARDSMKTAEFWLF